MRLPAFETIGEDSIFVQREHLQGCGFHDVKVAIALGTQKCSVHVPVATYRRTQFAVDKDECGREAGADDRGTKGRRQRKLWGTLSIALIRVLGCNGVSAYMTSMTPSASRSVSNCGPSGNPGICRRQRSSPVAPSMRRRICLLYAPRAGTSWGQDERASGAPARPVRKRLLPKLKASDLEY